MPRLPINCENDGGSEQPATYSRMSSPRSSDLTAEAWLSFIFDTEFNILNFYRNQPSLARLRRSSRSAEILPSGTCQSAVGGVGRMRRKGAASIARRVVTGLCAGPTLHHQGDPMDRVKSEDVIGGKGRPFTGAEYLESLRDGREVYVYGERVKDVTTHPAFRNAARSIARLYDALHDRQDQGVLTSPTDTGSAASPTISSGRRVRARTWWRSATPSRMGAHVLRLDGALARLQGVADEYARRQLRFLRQVRRQCEALVPARAGERPVHESRHRQSAGRPRQAGRPGEGRLHHHPEGDRRRHLRFRRQGGGDLVGADPLQFSRPERRRAAARHRSGGDVHRADERAGRQTVLPHLLRDDRERDGHAVRLSAVVALRRERRDLRLR